MFRSLNKNSLAEQNFWRIDFTEANYWSGDKIFCYAGNDIISYQLVSEFAYFVDHI